MAKGRLNGSSAPIKGITCMIGGAALLTANDAVIKWLTADYPVGQIMFLRGIFVLAPISFLIWHAGGVHRLQTRQPLLHLLRAALVICGTFLFVTGLRFLPLAEAIAIAFAGPLFITALAQPLLGESIGWRRWMAVFAGFCGVLIICQPGGAVFQWVALLTLAASLTGAFRDILTRKMAAEETSEAQLTFTSLGVTMGGLATIFITDWQPVAMRDWALFALDGLLIGGAHFLMIETFRYAEAGLVAPFKYSSVVWAALFGYFVFGDLPDQSTMIGGAVVIASGMYILHRERKRRC
ncbi:MAG: hypothetical protein CBB68_13780 [Rhodospirillaceae bacterium TMED8]|nr:hypothetical protein [Magnetovibrio sp.]OUT48309.1 MAG: hypothetical protein CBB68_13780 [Rhodospirillaceae bacterium TMED8]|tara:strand:+ start:1909 stop:2793 length:885 start_codon:yes stop_codon:yes gene_type:complete